MPSSLAHVASEIVTPARPTRPPNPPATLPTRQQLADYLTQLGFTRSSLDRGFDYPGLHVTLLDTPRLAVRYAGGLVYLSVASCAQLEEQLTQLGYQHPPHGGALR